MKSIIFSPLKLLFNKCALSFEFFNTKSIVLVLFKIATFLLLRRLMLFYNNRKNAAAAQQQHHHHRRKPEKQKVVAFDVIFNLVV